MFSDASKTSESFIRIYVVTSVLKFIVLVFEGCVCVYTYVHASPVKHGGESIPTDASLWSSELGYGTRLCKTPAPCGQQNRACRITKLL